MKFGPVGLISPSPRRGKRKLKSVVLVAPDNSEGRMAAKLVEGPVPTPGPGELVVKMEACGLCGTDLEKIRGGYTASLPVIGHEAVGRVHGVGEGVVGIKEKDAVFPHHHVPCYECYTCRHGNETMCDKYRSSSLVPGGFSQFFLVPRWNVSKGGVLRLPEEMSFELGSLIEPLGCCVRAMRHCQVKPTDTVLVAGAGPAGMMNALLLKLLGARVLMSDISDARLEFAERSGVSLALNPSRDDVPTKVRAETDGRGADLAVVASGSKEAILQGLRSVRKGGRVCLFGIPYKGSVLDYDISSLYNSEQSVITSYGATEEDTREALQVLSGRGREFAGLVTHKFPLSRFDAALEAASAARAMKVVLTP